MYSVASVAGLDHETIFMWIWLVSRYLMYVYLFVRLMRVSYVCAFVFKFIEFKLKNITEKNRLCGWNMTLEYHNFFNNYLLLGYTVWDIRGFYRVLF